MAKAYPKSKLTIILTTNAISTPKEIFFEKAEKIAVIIRTIRLKFNIAE